MMANENPGIEAGVSEGLAGKLTHLDFTPTFPTDDTYEARLEGWLQGYHSRDDEFLRLNWTADRYYAQMCARKPVPLIDPNRPSYAHLELIRADIYAGNQ